MLNDAQLLHALKEVLIGIAAGLGWITIAMLVSVAIVVLRDWPGGDSDA
jgi:hypothetical protein